MACLKNVNLYQIVCDVPNWIINFQMQSLITSHESLLQNNYTQNSISGVFVVVHTMRITNGVKLKQI